MKHCEDITATSCKPVTKTSCDDHVKNVPRQKVNEGKTLCKMDEMVSQAYASKGVGSKGLMDNKMIKMIASQVFLLCSLIINGSKSIPASMLKISALSSMGTRWTRLTISSARWLR